ncbi:hypothetical protein LCGC14_0635910 [marine sediment metagenome]|uniref:Uncharacterized protein n=1 Tax=marine sediment metagenome TaxID=412755 RepID=A0A0F9U8W0_9ZZZZ
MTLTLDFSKCKTAKDVTKVFNKKIKELVRVKRNMYLLLKNQNIKCPKCNSQGSIPDHAYECNFICDKCKGFGIIKK